MARALESCDVFCRVVDNFGDAGVALRLARQLADEHGLTARLFVDDLASVARIAPAIDAAKSAQPLRARLSVHAMATADGARPASLVVEAFGCGLPERYLDAMEACAPPPVWVNLEYLSAEEWVGGTHGLPSPPPRRRLRRWFFFPGFAPDTGGLLRERELLAARAGHVRDIAAHAAVWHGLGVSALPRDALTVSLFCYPNAAARALLERFAADDAPVVCVVPEGVASDAVHAFIGASRPGAPRIHHAGALSLVVAPFVDQLAFDARLWSCALNFVRGEDSFVRAQWAARPLVWHIYPQPDDVHLVKLDAFLARYVAGLAAPAAAALRDFWHAWNAQDGAGCVAAWPALRTALPTLGRHAYAWAGQLAVRPDLASALVEFARIRL